MSNQTRIDAMCVAAKEAGLGTVVAGILTLLREIHDDHATMKTVLDDIKAKYEAHRHSVAGAASIGTAPSTEAATAGATASEITQSLATLTASKPAALG
jgi:hypothetical protein